MLTEQQKIDLLHDFQEWSGGYAPDECEAHELAAFIEHAANADLDVEDVTNFLRQYGD